MGHLINPVSYRLTINRAWENSWFAHTSYEYHYLNVSQINIKFFIKKFFNLKVFPENGFLYSHSKIFNFSEKVSIRIFLYKTTLNLNFKVRKLRSLSFILAKNFYKHIMYKVMLQFMHLFKFYFFILKRSCLSFNLVFKRDNSNKRIFFGYCEKILFYVFLLLKRNRLQIFYSLLQSNVITEFVLKKKLFFKKHLRAKTSRKKKRVLTKMSEKKIFKKIINNKTCFFNMNILKVFIWFLRSHFWNKLSFFLTFFLSKFMSSKFVLHICKINYLGVNIQTIGNYIGARLKQRFKVMQIMAPVIKNLQQNKNILGYKFSFCGRFSRKEIATYEYYKHGAVPLNTRKALIEYALFGVILKDSYCGIKVWLNKKKEKLLGINFYHKSLIWKYYSK